MLTLFLAAVFAPQTGYFIDSVLGNDSNAGTSSLVPFQSLAALTGKRLTRVGIAAGSSLVANAFAPNNGNVLFYAYGSGPKPILHNVPNPESSGSWTNVSGNIYSKTTASTYTGQSIWWVDNSGTITHLLKGTAGALTANQFNITSTTLQVNIGRAPLSTDVFQIPQNTNQLVTMEGKNNITFQGISGRFSGSDCFQAAAATATDSVRLYQCELAWCAGGLFHTGTGAAATNMVADSCWFHDQYNQQNAYSMHCDVGAGNGAVLNCLIQRIAGHGITCQDTATLFSYKNVLDGGGDILIVGGGAGSPGVHTFIGNVQYNTPPERTGFEYRIQFVPGPPALAVGTVINLYNHTLALGTASVAQRGLYHGSGTLNIVNYLWYGNFDIALRGDFAGGFAAGQAARTTSNIGGSVFNSELFNWYIAGLSSSLNGPGDVSYGTSNPFNNLSGGDLTLISGSPGSLLRAAGAVIAGVTNSATPDIGYTGAA